MQVERLYTFSFMKDRVPKQAMIDELVSHRTAVPCVVNAGDAVIMRPHVLHKSSKSNQPKHRRVVHLEFSSFELPDGAAWA